MSATDAAVRTYVNRLAGVPALPGNTNRQRPEQAFATVLLVSSGAEGTPYEIVEAGAPRTLATSTLDYSVQFHGDGASESAQLFRDRADSGVYDLADGLVYQGASDIQRLDEVLSDEFHERAVVNVRLRRTQEVMIDQADAEAGSIILNINGEQEAPIR